MSEKRAVMLFISICLVSVLVESLAVDDAVKPVPPSCPENEEHRCQFLCPPESCITLYAAFDCIPNQTCVEGCYCKEGFLRVGDKGPCVHPDQCNPLDCVNDLNAQRGSGDKCGKTCSDYNNKTKICPEVTPKENGCDCKDGYVYDPNLNLCVKPEDCTKPCKPNQRYSTCLLGECGPKTCDNVGYPVACPSISADLCPAGCTCDYGYVMDKDGKCVETKTCPSCGGDPNAQAGCGNTCGKTCADLNTNNTDLTCAHFCDYNGCECKEGYLLDTDLKPPKCVLVNDCPKSSATTPGNDNAQCPGPHERYISCPAGQCNPKTCADLITPPPCPRVIPPCPGGCICEDGYLRDSNDKCIPQEQCPAAA